MVPRAHAAGAVTTLLALGIAACGGAAMPASRTTATAPASSSLTAPLDQGSAIVDPQRASTVLRATWTGYKHDFIESDGRVVDHRRNQVTTSEGQAYAMLRAAWLDDRTTFTGVWRWTRQNLRTGDGHFGWLWGRHGDGSWSLLDSHSASDADEDIALALAIAARRWSASELLDDARAVLPVLWADDVAQVRGTPYLAAGDWATGGGKPGPAINPSYLAPYAYRVFAGLDPQHPWLRLVESSYQALTAVSRSTLHASMPVFLPPNWAAVDAGSGAVVADPTMPQADSYGYDAFRVMWRIALDASWNDSPQARAYLAASGFLRQQWRDHHALAPVYGHDGHTLDGADDPTVYGGDVGDFLTTDPAGARSLVASKLLGAYSEDGGVAHFGDRMNYYEQNWVWFGIALAAGMTTAPDGQP